MSDKAHEVFQHLASVGIVPEPWQQRRLRELINGEPLANSEAGRDPNGYTTGRTAQEPSDGLHCPKCGSPAPKWHPAIGGGGEVTSICADPFHASPQLSGTRMGRLQPWCAIACPRQQTGLWRDCQCGGASREFEYLKGEREKYR